MHSFALELKIQANKNLKLPSLIAKKRLFFRGTVNYSSSFL